MRLPVVAIALALVCFAAFVPTWVLAERKLDTKTFEAFTSYYTAHPYLQLPRLARNAGARRPPVTGDKPIQQPSQKRMQEEQTQLDQLFERVVEASGGEIRKWALVPARGFQQVGWITGFFLHYGWMHLLGNLLFLYIVAPLLEEAWGRWRFLLFYLAGGVFANFTQFWLDPHSQIAIAGASGAIAACMGAFAIRFAAQKIRMAYFIWFIRIFVGTKMVPAWFSGIAWFGLEIWDLYQGGAAGVATGAHVGGFALGALVAISMKMTGLEKNLLTSEEAAFDARQFVDLFQNAETLAAQGDVQQAREQLLELLKLMPEREDAQLLLAELDLRSGQGATRFERAIRQLMMRNDSTALTPALLRIAPHLDASLLSSPFALQVSRYISSLKGSRLDRLLEPLLAQAQKATGRIGEEATRILEEQRQSFFTAETVVEEPKTPRRTVMERNFPDL